MNSGKSRKYYINGVLDGSWREWHDNKTHTLKFDGHYVSGKKDGLWEEWYDDDKGGTWGTPYEEQHTLKSRCHYVKGERHGHWTEFDLNGVITSDCEYCNGIKQ